MNSNRIANTRTGPALIASVLSLFWLQPAGAEAPADYNDEYDQSYGYDNAHEPAAQSDGLAVDVVILAPDELDELVGRVALYPDDLLAIVLPASTYPEQIVQAVRFLDAHEQNPKLQPDEEWDESVTALLNYPKVLRMMHDDIDWTWQLGGAVLNQQQDVIEAVEGFRDRAYAAGNLKSDRHQTVKQDGDVIVIQPADPEVIYVPYYEPRRVVVRQAAPVYYYYPEPYPVYYYPYPAGHSFLNGYFWGVTTAYTIGWSTHGLRVYHRSFRGHPYYGYSYFGNYYRRPSVHVHNTWYVRGPSHYSSDRYRVGDRWRHRPHQVHRPGGNYRPPPVHRDNQRRDPAVARQPDGLLATQNNRRPGTLDLQRERDRDRGYDTVARRPDVREQTGRKPAATRRPNGDEIRFRERPATATADRPVVREQTGRKPAATRRPNGDEIRFRERPATAAADRPDVREQTGRKPAATQRTGRDEIRFRERRDTVATTTRPDARRANPAVVRTATAQPDTARRKPETRRATPARRETTSPPAAGRTTAARSEAGRREQAAPVREEKRVESRSDRKNETQRASRDDRNKSTRSSTKDRDRSASSRSTRRR